MLSSALGLRDQRLPTPVWCWLTQPAVGTTRGKIQLGKSKGQSESFDSIASRVNMWPIMKIKIPKDSNLVRIEVGVRKGGLRAIFAWPVFPERSYLSEPFSLVHILTINFSPEICHQIPAACWMSMCLYSASIFNSTYLHLICFSLKAFGSCF